MKTTLFVLSSYAIIFLLRHSCCGGQQNKGVPRANRLLGVKGQAFICILAASLSANVEAQVSEIWRSTMTNEPSPYYYYATTATLDNHGNTIVGGLASQVGASAFVAKFDA